MNFGNIVAAVVTNLKPDYSRWISLKTETKVDKSKNKLKITVKIYFHQLHRLGSGLQKHRQKH